MRGAAQVGTHCFACTGEHQETFPKLAKQTGEDQGGTLFWVNRKKEN